MILLQAESLPIAEIINALSNLGAAGVLIGAFLVWRWIEGKRNGKNGSSGKALLEYLQAENETRRGALSDFTKNVTEAAASLRQTSEALNRLADRLTQQIDRFADRGPR